ncbi:MAG: protein kinase [Gemmatimonadota bacterium]
MIGRYKLLELIGEGGFGVVYMAEQEEPVRRRLALKIIKLGMDTRQVIARFEAERQALAMMEHPNIAKVLDAGATDSGRPYFVMELVRGLPITRYCDDYKLDTRERLELFIDVCNAVQHAHQKGIIHRDLKPNNVLVTRHDGQPVPKVIDFGVAKATHLRLTEKTMFTGYGQFIGTPAYMSPEQAELSGLDIDTRSDIYSLGVLLYELLTGTTPFDARNLLQVAFLAMQRILKEEEPPRPSTRLSTLGDTLQEMARHRGTEPATLTRLIQGDLDWIVMKALEKDRRRRYESASELAADIRRHFDDEPVIAGPPTATYRLRKLLARHRGPVAAAGAIVATIVLLGSLSTWFGWRATQAAARVHASGVLAAAAATEDPLLKAQLILELADLPEVPGRLAVAREAANSSIPIAVLRGHERTLTDAAFSDDGARVVTTGRDGAAIVWNVDGTGEPIILTGYRYGVGGPAFSPDGQLVAASSNGGIHVWPSGGGEPAVLEEAGPFYPPYAFDPGGAYLLAGSSAGTAYLWPIGEWESPRALGSHRGPITDVAFDSAGTLLATASEDGTVRIMAADGSGDAVVLRGHEAAVRSVDFSSDGGHLVSASDDGTARVWSTDGNGPVTVLRDRDQVPVTLARFIHLSYLVEALSEDGQTRFWRIGGDEPEILYRKSGIETLVHSRNGRRTAITVSGKTARVWRQDGEGSPSLLRGHELGLNGVALSPDGKLAVTVGGTAARIWKADAPGEALTIGTPAHRVASAVFDPDGERYAAGFEDGTVELGSVDDASPPVTLRGHGREVRSVAFSPDATRLVTGSGDGTARVWWTDGSGAAVVLEGHEGEVTSTVFSPDMLRIATGSTDGTVRLWSSDGRGEPIVLTGPPRGSPAGRDAGRRAGLGLVQFSSDGAWLVAVRQTSPEPAALVWQLNELGDPLVLGASEQIEDVRFSPDGTRIVIASTDGTATLWSLDDPEAPLVFDGHLDEVLTARFSPDSRFVVTSSTDATARVWSAEDAREISVLRGHARTVTHAAFGPRGTHIVTASSVDTTARVWPLDGSTQPLVLRGHRWERIEGLAFSAEFSPSGTHVMTLGGGLARIWRITWPGLLDHLRRSVSLCLTADQRMRHLGESAADAQAGLAACETRSHPFEPTRQPWR